MATAVSINFCAGRFHATQWGRHVNEGVAEWPPSPWRLLRSLVAVWKRKLDDHPDCDPAVIKSLFEKLAEPPLIALPRAGTGHTRHYMPTTGKNTKVFDVFVAIDRKDELVFFWPNTILSGLERSALAVLVDNLSFLGRAESWCEGRLPTEGEFSKLAANVNCLPLGDAEVRVDQEIVRVLCADAGEAFQNEHTPKATIGKAGIPLYDPDWHLCMETLELHKQKWSDPPGAQWVQYVRRADCFSIQQKSQPRKLADDVITAARFVIDAQVLPLVKETLPVAELVRRHLMGIYRRIEETRLRAEGVQNFPLPRSEVFSGKDVAGRPLEGHMHLYVMPSDEDDDGRLDHITVLAERGFDYAELTAIDKLRVLNRGPDHPGLNLMLVGLGRHDGMRAPMFARSKTWVSRTPFLAPRHPKARGTKRDRPELLGQQNRPLFTQAVLREELARLAARRQDVFDVDSVIVEPLDDGQIGAHRLRPIQFTRSRAKRGDDGARRPAGGFKITFPEPINGPICLGYSAHFGMGQFFPESW